MRLFGTNGIREVVGERLTPAMATAVASAIGASTPVGPPIVVGWDGRTASPALARVVSGALALYGHRVIELGVLPTPAIQHNVTLLGAQLGVIITASHNPPEYDGIKCIAADGLEVVRSVEEQIEALVDTPPARSVPFDRVGTITRDRSGATRYIDDVVARVDAARIASRRFTVVLDPANGAAIVTSPTILRRLGCRVVTLNGHLDGTFPGRRSEPTDESLGELKSTVPALRADLGIAHDGDADRTIFVDGAGRFIPGERILALLARDRVRQHPGGVIVTPVTASQAVEDVVRPLGGSVVYTRVGSPTVTREMQRRSSVFGGEENGGLIFPELQLARDGGMTAAAVLDYLAREGVNLEQALEGLPDYTLVKRSVDCPKEIRDAVVARVLALATAAGDRTVTIDGVKVFRDGGWVLVRPSGTEAIVRVFAEARTAEQAHRLADEGVRWIRGAIDGPPPVERG